MKFEIFKSEKNDKFYFRLKAKNGQVILSSQGYANKEGCKKGIESVKKHATDDANYERKESDSGKFHFSLKSANHQVIGSSQMYANKASMEKGVESVKNTAPEAELVEVTA